MVHACVEVCMILTFGTMFGYVSHFAAAASATAAIRSAAAFSAAAFRAAASYRGIVALLWFNSLGAVACGGLL